MYNFLFLAMHIYRNIEKLIEDFFALIYKLFNYAINMWFFCENVKLNIEIVLYHIFQALNNSPKVFQQNIFNYTIFKNVSIQVF